MASPGKKNNNIQVTLKKVLEKKLDMKKLSGKLIWKGDAVALQRKLRSNDR